MKNEIIIFLRIIEKETAQIKASAQFSIKRNAQLDYLLETEDHSSPKTTLNERLIS